MKGQEEYTDVGNSRLAKTSDEKKDETSGNGRNENVICVVMREERYLSDSSH